MALPSCGGSDTTSAGGDDSGSGGSGPSTTASTTGAGGAGGGGGPACEETPTGIAVGAPGDFVAGLNKAAAAKALIGRDEGGLYALTALCTHELCNMDKASDGTISETGIRCNCHGSRFDNLGNVTKGPATKPLKAYALALGCDGQLYVDKATVVPNTTRLVV